MSIQTEIIRINYRALGRKRGVQAAIKRAALRMRNRLTRYGSEVMDWSFKHVPKRTGRLQRALRRVLRSSTMTRIKIGTDDVIYAGYVDAMQPVINWTPIPEGHALYHFFEKFYKLVERQVRKLLRAALEEENVKKYIAMSYTRMVEEILE